jgi:hypothetical protein
MSRAKPVDNSATVSLFPFLAVLLCTMGALLVVLVAMTRSARDAALRRAEAATPSPTVTEPDPDVAKEIHEAKQFVSKLEQVRSDALHKLREDQRRLSHLEDHMRRLQDQLEKLQIAASELEALEGEHYDDREQAEREVKRLQELIEDTREAIDDLKNERNTKKRSYALVPYEGPHGTTRRPIFVECRQGELILQPEGVRVSRDDLRPPLGAGNPLATALRAARDYLIRLHPEEGQSRQTEPYPLIIVRPSGAAIYGIAQRAMQSSDFQFGYELVEEDWDLKYPAADPQLAIVEQRAIDQARARQEALAAAAPRAYRHPALAAAGRFEFGDGDGEGAYGAWADGDSDEPDDGELPGTGSALSNEAESDVAGASEGSSSKGEANGQSSGQFAAGSSDPSSSGGSESSPHGDADATQRGALPAGSTADSASRVAANGNSQSMSSAPDGDSSLNASAGKEAPGTPSVVRMQADGPPHEADLSVTRGEDWALKRKKPRAVAVRRTIQVVVRKDHVVIVSDNVRANTAVPVGKTVSLQRDTVESIDDFVAAVQSQIEGWGMAGDGLYWRPVLQLHVAPDGARRAQDLARLLKNSGLDIPPPATANFNSRGYPRATR